jgi:hypothetical protein
LLIKPLRSQLIGGLIQKSIKAPKRSMRIADFHLDGLAVLTIQE